MTSHGEGEEKRVKKVFSDSSDLNDTRRFPTQYSLFHLNPYIESFKAVSLFFKSNDLDSND